MRLGEKSNRGYENVKASNEISAITKSKVFLYKIQLHRTDYL